MLGLVVDILFKTKKLAKCCLQERVMTKELGPTGAKKLKARLADLQAASNMGQVRRGHPHPLSGAFQGCVGLDLDGGNRLVVAPATEAPPMLPAGGVDWSKVDAVRVVFIGNYHG